MVFVVSSVVGRTRTNIRFSIVVRVSEMSTGVVLGVPELTSISLIRFVSEDV